MPNKFVHIEDALINEPVEFLCVSETKLSESHLQGFHIPQYRTYRHDRPPNLNGKRDGRGLITLVKGNISSRRRPEFESKDAVTLCIEMSIKAEKWMVICCYNPKQI